MTLSEIVDILKSYTIHKFSWIPKYSDYSHLVQIEEGCVLLYNCEDKFQFKTTKSHLEGDLDHWIVQGEYVFFFYENLYKLDFEFEKLIESSIEYEALDLLSIEKQAIIIHKKYIHTLCIHNHLHKTLNFTPAKKLKLIISSFKNGKLIESLKI